MIGRRDNLELKTIGMEDGTEMGENILADVRP